MEDELDWYEAHDGDVFVECDLCGKKFVDGASPFDRSHTCTECVLWEQRNHSRWIDQLEKRRKS